MDDMVFPLLFIDADSSLNYSGFVFQQERDLGDEYGWKQVHGDVFRPSAHATFFSALIGSGYHITVVTISVILLTIVGELYTE